MQIIHYKTKKNNRSSSQSNDLRLEFNIFPGAFMTIHNS